MKNVTHKVCRKVEQKCYEDLPVINPLFDNIDTLLTNEHYDAALDTWLHGVFGSDE